MRGAHERLKVENESLQKRWDEARVAIKRNEKVGKQGPRAPPHSPLATPARAALRCAALGAFGLVCFD